MHPALARSGTRQGRAAAFRPNMQGSGTDCLSTARPAIGLASIGGVKADGILPIRGPADRSRKGRICHPLGPASLSSGLFGARSATLVAKRRRPGSQAEGEPRPQALQAPDRGSGKWNIASGMCDMALANTYYVG